LAGVPSALREAHSFAKSRKFFRRVASAAGILVSRLYHSCHFEASAGRVTDAHFPNYLYFTIDGGDIKK